MMAGRPPLTLGDEHRSSQDAVDTQSGRYKVGRLLSLAAC